MNPHEAFRLRSMRESDIDAVLAIEQSSPSAPHWGAAQYLAAIVDREDQEEESQALRRFAVVAETGGDVAGFAVVRLIAALGEVEAELESVVVASRRRGHGIGAALLTASLCKAKAAGARFMDLEVRASNVVAVRLYERSGFREAGRRPEYYGDPVEDAVLMRANL